MLLEALGLLLSSVTLSLWLLYKLTGDVYPRGLKKFLLKIILNNWQSSLRRRFGTYNLSNPETAEETALLPCSEDIQLEQLVKLQHEGDVDSLVFYSIDDHGNAILTRVQKHYGGVSEGTVYIRFNGKSYHATCTGESSLQDFGVGTLKLELVQAMRCWRLWFNGILTEESGVRVHATVNALWKPLEEPYDLQKEANSDLIAEDLSRSGGFGSRLLDLKRKIPLGYAQFGATHCWIQVESAPKQELYLYGLRRREQQNLYNESGKEKIELFSFSGEDGNAVQFSSNDGIWTHGNIHHVSGVAKPLINIGTSVTALRLNKSVPKYLTVTGKRDTYSLETWQQLSNLETKSLSLEVLKMRLNSLNSYGIILRQNAAILSGNLRSKIPWHVENSVVQQSVDFVPLDSEACLNVKLVGGKGASLAALDRLIQDKGLTEQYKTSPGFCVTTAFFRRILDIDHFERIFNTATNDAELADACITVQNLILHSKLEDTVGPLIAVWMTKTFVEVSKGKFSHMIADRFAVRSSGVLEDATDVSAAGQNETYLGVKEEQVPSKVLACWASLFTFQSVRYRLNHGQPAVSDMGVVVQAMVNAKAAGVMFTADPITGNPFEILINANYGLGESVVSATCDPDTIKVHRSKEHSRALKVASKTVGVKVSKVVMNDSSLGSTKEVAIDDAEAQQCCIDDETAVKLASFGVILTETNDGKPVDVEWAVDGNNIYILQSRNITSLDLWTDEEIIHEFDSALRTQFERLSTGNTGEVAPGACSPLAQSSMMRIFDLTIQVKMEERFKFSPAPNTYQAMVITRHRLMINIIQIMYRSIGKEMDPALVAVDLSVFGHQIIDEEIFRLALNRWGPTPGLMKLRSFIMLLQLIAKGSKEVQKAAAKFSQYSFPIEDVQDDCQVLWDRILKELPALYEVGAVHLNTSDASSGMQVLTTMMLAEGKPVEDWGPGMHTDVSKMVSVRTDVESADVPAAMEKLANHIAAYCKQNGTELPKDPREALEFITGNADLKIAYDEFMDKHGHRCIFEMDFLRQSWGTNPVPFVKLLQNIVTGKLKHGEVEKKAEKVKLTDAELIDSLQTPQKNSTKRILKFMLPYCRSTVWNREKTKSLVVWACNEFRKAFNRLGKLMAKERLIPDANLVFFMTLDEIRQVVERRDTSSRILFKAMRRRKLHPMLDKEEFPEVMVGIPKPIDHSEQLELGDSIRGTPVSSGKVQGTVKVCLSVEDAAELIQPGDIMVAHSTDIAWSPFFPILGGVVTELGGLISHGAVVAREYGLPCIVGAANATKIFKSGETVLLDATNGIMSKVAS